MTRLSLALLLTACAHVAPVDNLPDAEPDPARALRATGTTLAIVGLGASFGSRASLPPAACAALAVTRDTATPIGLDLLTGTPGAMEFDALTVDVTACGLDPLQVDMPPEVVDALLLLGGTIRAELAHADRMPCRTRVTLEAAVGQIEALAVEVVSGMQVGAQVWTVPGVVVDGAGCVP
jgi:hypothetical protein